MNKTLNQRIYETPGDIKKAIYDSGKREILDEIDDILDRCAHDNGAMIIRELKELKERYGVKQ